MEALSTRFYSAITILIYRIPKSPHSPQLAKKKAALINASLLYFVVPVLFFSRPKPEIVKIKTPPISLISGVLLKIKNQITLNARINNFFL